jgi:hypothetical protein
MFETGQENKVHLQADGSPDWDAITFDVLCSWCGYNLRTLTRPKCTECGLDFDWRRVLDGAAFQNPFLIEHNWRRRPFRSWWLTVWRSLWPNSFWERISLHENVRPGPLIAHFFFGIVTAFVLLHGSAWVLGRALLYAVGPMKIRLMGAYRAGIRERFYTLATRLEELAEQPFNEGWSLLGWKVLAVATPFFGTLVLLFALRQTMRRYRVRSIQVLRVVAYIATPVCLWCALAYLLAYYVLPSLFRFMHFRMVLQISFMVVVWGVFSWYLWRGFRQYLHLPHAAILGMTAALVGMLTLVTGNMVVAAFRELLLG